MRRSARANSTTAQPDDQGLRAAYAAHGGELYRFALHLLHDPGLAEEVVQDSFVRAWRAWDSYDPQVASLRTWLFAIARNLAMTRCGPAR